ncbi:hypothetical protein [Halioxenophilus aromaticivorans]|uniref:hypothetical protein n=1 Tax=Halioxenophilus aromaticivorans TaxID=1306992 RepID=UPI0031E7D962
MNAHTLTALLRDRLAKSSTLFALLALLLCAQIADSHHLAEHAHGGDESGLCDSLHTPAAALSTSVGLCLPEPQVAHWLNQYQTPAFSPRRNAFRAIRAPPHSTKLG